MQAVPTPRSSSRGDARRRLIAQNALEVLGRDGLHGLTHRAVDAAAGLATGSCAFAFRTRRSLVLAAVDRLSELDRQDLTSAREASGRFDVLKLMRHWASAGQRTILLARLEAHLAAAREPEIRERVLRNRAYFAAIVEDELRRKGVASPDRAADHLLSLVDGELLRTAVVTSIDSDYEPSGPLSRELSRYA